MLLGGVLGEKGQEQGEHDTYDSQHVAPSYLTLPGIVHVRVSAERLDQAGVETEGVNQ